MADPYGAGPAAPEGYGMPQGEPAAANGEQGYPAGPPDDSYGQKRPREDEENGFNKRMANDQEDGQQTVYRLLCDHAMMGASRGILRTLTCIKQNLAADNAIEPLHACQRSGAPTMSVAIP